MDGISRSRGWDKEIPHGVLPMEQLVLSDKWARNTVPLISEVIKILETFKLQFSQINSTCSVIVMPVWNFA